MSAAMVLAVTVLAAGRAGGSASEKTGKTVTAEEVVKALAFDDNSDLGRAMSDVSDGTTQWRETALFLLLKRVGALGSMAPGEMALLDRPAYRSLLAEPKRYRARPIRLTVRVHTVMKMTGRQLGAGDAVWPADRAVWRLFCSDASLPVDRAHVVICSAVEPTGLGEPSAKNREDRKRFDPDELIYKHAPEVEVACVFYKTYRDKQKDADRQRDYPVVVAWQVAAPPDRSIANPTDPRYLAGALLIAAVCIVYYFVRRYTKRFKKSGPRIQYRPKRDESNAADDAAPAKPGGEDDQPVDPLLAAAAEEYQRERQDRDAHDNR